MSYILRSSEKILDHFISIREVDRTFVFVPRKINKGGRLDQGYWFLGNHWYMNISLWNGVDWKERVNIIGLSINDKKEAYIELSAQGNPNSVGFLNKLASKVVGLKKSKNKNKWFKLLPGKKLSDHINYFVYTFKPIVDELLLSERPKEIAPLDEAFFKKYTEKIIARRKAQITFGEYNKIARLVWNINNWKFPSGAEGKSTSEGNFEAGAGYGHEEWLFDRTKPLNGFHYAFVQALNLETDLHVGKRINLSLYTTTKSEKFFVGTISNIEVISETESIWAYSEYKKNGWLKKMEDDLTFVEANTEDFKQTPDYMFFNIKYRFTDLRQPDELLKISSDDPNITNNRFNLLPLKTEVVVDSFIDEEEDEGKAKSTKKVKRSVNYDGEFSPYHNLMQNEINIFLKASKLYKKVCIEKGRVDLKGLTHDNKWHYFEIKTDNPKMSVRKALGQILEYSHYPNHSRAERLIIVGDTPPSDDLIRYLKLLRGKFGLPLTYRCFDFSKKVLSMDY